MFSHPNQNMVGRHASRRQQTSIGTPRQRIDGGVLLIVRTEKFTPGVFLIFWVVLIAGVGGAGQTPKTNPGLTTDSQTSAAQRLPFHAGDVPLKLMFQFEGQPTRHIFVVSVCTIQEDRHNKKRGTTQKKGTTQKIAQRTQATKLVSHACLGEKETTTSPRPNRSYPSSSSSNCGICTKTEPSEAAMAMRCRSGCQLVQSEEQVKNRERRKDKVKRTKV